MPATRYSRKMRISCALSVVAVALLAVLVTGTVGCGSSEESQVYELKFATVLPPSGAYSDVDQWFADEVERRTDGRVTIEIGWSNAFGSIQELPGMLQAGALDIALYAPGFDPQRFPIWGFVNETGFKFGSLEAADEVARMLVDEFPEATAEFASLGTTLLFTHHGTNELLMGNKEVRQLEDMSGARIRTDGEWLPRAVQAAGAVPVSITVPEYYESMERGVIDLMFNTLTGMVDSHHLEEVSKYLITASAGCMIGPQILVSNKTLDKLPSDLEDILFEVADEAQEKDLEIQGGYEERALETCHDAGVEVIIFPAEDQLAWKEMAPDSVAAWVDGMEAKGNGDLANRIVERMEEITGEFVLDTSLYQ